MSSPTADRCTSIRLSLVDAERSVQDPKLAALVRDGWTVIASVPAQSEDGPPIVVLIFAPPVPKPEIVAIAEPLIVPQSNTTIVEHAKSFVVMLVASVLGFALAKLLLG